VVVIIPSSFWYDKILVSEVESWRGGRGGGGGSNCGGKKRRGEVRGCFTILVTHRKNKGVWPTGTDGTSVKLLVDLMVVSLLLLIHDHINQRRLHLSMTRT
jgi:hypothetical protein